MDDVIGLSVMAFLERKSWQKSMNENDALVVSLSYGETGQAHWRWKAKVIHIVKFEERFGRGGSGRNDHRDVSIN
jgi:hypothetical protein